MKPVAVIILNWNGAALLRKYLPSVIANTNADIADVIVADNGSTDESVKVLKEEFPQGETPGFAPRSKCGARHLAFASRGRFLPCVQRNLCRVRPPLHTLHCAP